MSDKFKMAKDMKKKKTIWEPGGHIESYREEMWRAYVSHSLLSLRQVWKRKRSGYVWIMAEDMKKRDQNGCLADILDRNTK